MELLLFSSPHHFLQGSGQRTGMAIAEHFTFYALADAFIQSDLHCIQVTVLHLSALAFPGNRTHDLGIASAMLTIWELQETRSLVLCPVTHFCVVLRFVVFGLLSGWKIQTWPIISFLTESVTYWFFICWYLIESMMPCVYKDVQDLQQKYRPTTLKYSSILLYTWGTCLSLCAPNPSWVFAAKKLFF